MNKNMCLRCGKIFNRKSNMRQHFNRTKLCDINLLEVSYDEMLNNYNELSNIVNGVYEKKHVKMPKKGVFIPEKVYFIAPTKHVFAENKKKSKKNKKKPDLLNRVYSCKKCEREFKYQSSYSRHYNKCIDNINDESSNKIYNFGEEKTNHLTDKKLLEIFVTPNNAIQKMCKEIHFNNKQPKNQNIKLTNKTSKYISIYIKNKWCTISIDKVYNKIINYNIFILNDFLKRLSHRLSYSDRQNFETFKIGMKHNKKLIKNIKISLKELFVNREVVDLV